jgi:hypothetical protein
MLNISLSPTKALAVVLSVLLTPIKALRLRYVPLLLVYFAYGSNAFTAIAEMFWVKDSLDMSAADLAELGIWLTVPWTVKMIFGSLVDSVLIFGSNRKSYVYIGALLITISSLMMIAVVGDYSIVAEFSKKSVYIFASVIAVVGFVMQDVVAKLTPRIDNKGINNAIIKTTSRSSLKTSASSPPIQPVIKIAKPNDKRANT